MSRDNSAAVAAAEAADQLTTARGGYAIKQNREEQRRISVKESAQESTESTSESQQHQQQPSDFHQLNNQKALFQAFAKHSTAHGVAHLASSGIRRAVWTCILLMATAGFLVHFSELVSRYLQCPINTEIDEEGADFEMPDVTLCPNDYASRYYANVNIANDFDTNRTLYEIPFDVARVWHLLKNETTDMPLHPYSSYWDARLSLKQVAYRNKSFTSAHEIIVYCRYNSIPCDYRNFTVYKDSTLFLCFTFRPESRQLVRSGSGGGLSLVLYNSADSFLTEREQLFHLPGFLVSVHPAGTVADFEQSAFLAPLRHVTVAELRMRHNHKVDRTSQPCIASRPPATYVTDFSRPWESAETRQFATTQEDCLQQVRQAEFVVQCGCFADHILVTKDAFGRVRPCHELPEVVFFRDIYIAFEISGDATWFYYTISNASGVYVRLDDFIFRDHWTEFQRSQTNIRCFYDVKNRQDTIGIEASSCYEECVQKKYTFATVSYGWPSNRSVWSGTTGSPLEAVRLYIKQRLAELNSPVWQKALDNLNSELNENYAVLDIHPNSIRSSVYREDLAFPLRNLFSDFGGILGLWIGISVITVVEFLEYAALSLWLLRKRLRQLRQERQQRQCVNQMRVPEIATVSSGSDYPSQFQQQQQQQKQHQQLWKFGANGGSSEEKERTDFSTVYVDLFPKQASQQDSAIALGTDAPVDSSLNAIQHKKAWIQKLFGI